MAAGVHVWAIAVTLGGVDVTTRLRGRVWHRQEESAAHLAQVRLALATSDPDAEADAAEGLALALSVRWTTNGTVGAWSVRFAGWVQTADYEDAEGVLILDATDRLQETFEALGEAAVDALLVGTLRRPETQAARTDGWQQAQECLKTVQGSIAIGRDAVLRLIPWDASSADLALTASTYQAQGVRRVRRPVRERVNRVSYRVSVRGVRLSQWIISAGWGSSDTYCDWYADPWVRPPVASIAQAVQSCGPLYVAAGTIGSGVGDGGGINYTLPPETGAGSMSCGGSQHPYWQDPTVCVAAEWRWRLTSRQLVEIVYTLQIDCEASQARYGVLVDERHATLDQSDRYQGWESADLARPEPEEWEECPGGVHWLAIDPAEEAAVLASALAEGAAAIRGTHRTETRVAALPWAVAALDLHSAVTLDGGTRVRRVAGIEEGWDLESWEVETTIVLREVLDLGDAAATWDALDPPERLPVPATYEIESDITYPLRLGGRTESPALTGAELGVMTNYMTTDEGAEVYPYRARFERPAVPDGARASITVTTETPIIYRVTAAAQA